MSAPTAFCIVSGTILLFFIVVFQIEARRGRRFFPVFRSHIDFWMLKVRHTLNVRLRNAGRYFIRQTGHYFLHTFLTRIIAGLGGLEEKLSTALRANRVLAKKSDRERSEMNKLDEIALHKMEMALTEEEKRIRKKRSLEG